MKKIVALVTVLALVGTGTAYARSHNGPMNHNGYNQGYCSNNMNHSGMNHRGMNHQGMMNQGGGFMNPNGGSPMGGFNGQSAAVKTVEAAKQLSDNSRVLLRGYITQALGDEMYTFKDDSGTISVEIDNRVWRGQNVAATDLIEIYGKVDVNKSSTDIEVKRLIKLPPVAQPK
ncbi:NirD/YgiW/YdeI family stress tolerance protein [Zophobihabitans entericus]|uniref:NirD/YgiW/YdeI family stress tolerance protein n=1 Tax=Zophobihabitans entericus TaxID=1635327 RepID=A0A6G9I8P8_9GAMM|nr:NirD/YgiW/YdeI family stress tolerance protein [Zophobihabitans entericus]QIQ20591.1 NirD/YgiW/YdeI family stress tolerance protein [Zophobihabitans entericus]